MKTLNETTELLASVGFVIGLAVIGLWTHSFVDDLRPHQSVLNGDFQSVYEHEFVKANPLNAAATAIMGAVKYAGFREAEAGAVIGKDGWIFTAEEFETHEDFDANLSRSADEIVRVQTLLQSHGVTLIPVIIPDKAEVYSEFLRVERPIEVATRRAKLMSLLASNGVTALDAFDVLGASHVWKDGFIKDDTHWSPKGSLAVAKMVAAHQATTDVQLTPATVTTTKGPAQNYDGDLLKFVPTGNFRATIGPSQHQLETYVTTVEAEGGLFGDASIDVALVGTSFSAKSEWNFAGFLQQELGADVLNFSTEGQGPFTPMRTYLASDDFQNAPPKIVIWEIPARYTSKDLNQ